MSHDECDRILALEKDRTYDRSRMGEICQRLDKLEKDMQKIVKAADAVRYFVYGMSALIIASQLGLIDTIKLVL